MIQQLVNAQRTVRKTMRIMATAAGIAFRIPAKLRPCVWVNRHVVIPAVAAATEPGPLDTSRVPPMEGLMDLAMQKHVRTFTLKKSARTGGTLLCFALMLYKIAEAPGPVLWVDPSRASARQLFRRELEPFLLACLPVAEQAIRTKEHWTAAQCFFKGGAFLKMAGAGSPNELAGFNAEWVFINESGKIHHTTKGEAPAHQLAEARVKLFPRTSKVFENSTPTDEFGAVTVRHQKGSRHQCYLPCPHCTAKHRATPRGPRHTFTPPEVPTPGWSPAGHDPTLAGWQPLTFFPGEEKVPFAEDLTPLPAGEFRLAKTGSFQFGGARITETRVGEDGKPETVEVGWDSDLAETETWYQCVNGCRIEQTSLNWMLRRFRWMATNPKASRSHVSAHWWAAYSPFERWGSISKRYLLAMGDPGAMHDLYNNYFGLEFKSVATEVDASDVERLRDASPRYLLGTIPSGPKAGGFEPFVLTMAVDVQKQGGEAPFWWNIFAWGIAWDLPGWPTVGVLVDYGSAVAWTQIQELAGILPLSAHAGGRTAAAAPARFNEYLWHDPATGVARPMRVYTGLVDSGDQAQSEADVYQFCRDNRDIFAPAKGGSRGHCRGNVVYLSEVDDKRLTLTWFWSDYFCQTVYRRIIKDRKLMRWLPSNIDPEFIEQLCDEHTVPKKGGGFMWVARRKKNHQGDCWKEQEVQGLDVEPILDAERVKRLAQMEAEAEGKLETLRDRVRKLTTAAPS
ncbi:MAG TPA: terminase gpA endonuclease subunit [Chthoniobacteraceae bacterium]|jgi:hypothetical protein|nr:terminase gpA endonuclease subunit [Chthoniobacteraceae bacterium]